jgi:hypothetical protein
MNLGCIFVVDDDVEGNDEFDAPDVIATNRILLESRGTNIPMAEVERELALRRAILPQMFAAYNRVALDFARDTHTIAERYASYTASLPFKAAFDITKVAALPSDVHRIILQYLNERAVAARDMVARVDVAAILALMTKGHLVRMARMLETGATRAFLLHRALMPHALKRAKNWKTYRLKKAAFAMVRAHVYPRRFALDGIQRFFESTIEALAPAAELPNAVQLECVAFLRKAMVLLLIYQRTYVARKAAVRVAMMERRRVAAVAKRALIKRMATSSGGSGSGSGSGENT